VSLADNKYDIIIAGAGPAGSSTSIRLTHSGLKVLLVEQKKFPRPKLCGEFISPECLAHFADLNVLDEMQVDSTEIDRTVFFARNGRAVAVPSEWFTSGSYAMGLSRAQMDDRLLKRARETGAVVLEDTAAAALLFDGDVVNGLRLKNGTETFEVRAPLVIDATGRARILSRDIEKRNGGQRRKRADFVAFKAHLENVAINDGDCEIYGYRGGYGGCSRVEGGLHNLCFIVSAELAREHKGDAHAIMRNVVFGNRRAAESLKDARILGEWLAVPIENYGRAELAPAEGLLAIGDAAAFIDPFTGSGILLALENAKVAAEVIVNQMSKPFGSLADEYARRYRSAFDHRLRISSVVRAAAFAPFLAEIVVRTLSLSEWLTRRLARATRRAEPLSHP